MVRRQFLNISSAASKIHNVEDDTVLKLYGCMKERLPNFLEIMKFGSMKTKNNKGGKK
jgi:hypothetical protein